MRFLSFLLVFFSFFACSNDASDCKYGKPVAIFSESINQIKKQSFELIGQKGIETVEFDDGKILELYQSGCNEVRQEYRFFLTGNYKNEADTFWFEKATERLSYVGNLDERYATIGLWVGALQSLSGKMSIGQFSEVEPSTFIMVDKIVESESAMVIIILERRI